MLNDPLAAVLSKIQNAEKIGKAEVLITPASKIIKKILDLMNQHGYIGKYEEIQKERGGVLKIHLIGQINRCNVIKPRFAVKRSEFEKYEKRYLPAKNMGLIFITTPKGIMIHDEAKKNNLGGKLLAYCY